MKFTIFSFRELTGKPMDLNSEGGRLNLYSEGSLSGIQGSMRRRSSLMDHGVPSSIITSQIKFNQVHIRGPKSDKVINPDGLHALLSMFCMIPNPYYRPVITLITKLCLDSWLIVENSSGMAIDRVSSSSSSKKFDIFWTNSSYPLPLSWFESEVMVKDNRNKKDFWKMGDDWCVGRKNKSDWLNWGELENKINVGLYLCNP